MNHVVVVIISRYTSGGGREYLLVRSTRDFGRYSGYYYPPGGHVEDGEDERQAIVRELREELGVEVTPVEKIAETPGDVPDQVTHWWRCEADSENFSLDKEEVQSARWFTLDDLLRGKRVWPTTVRFFRDYVAPRRSV